MTTIEVTIEEHAEIQAIADKADPLRRGRTVGAPASVARLEAQIASTCTRVADGGPTLGYSQSIDTTRDQTAGTIDLSQEHGWKLLDTPGAEISVATRGVVLAGVGERGPNRRFSLRFRFDRFGDGR